MSTRRLWAIARKEFLHVIRDPRSLAMAIAMPLLLMMLYGYALSLDVDDVPTVVWDQSESPASREFISAFNGSRYFSIRAHLSNYREVEEAIDSGRALVALIVPRNFAGRIESGREASVQLSLGQERVDDGARVVHPHQPFDDEPPGLRFDADCADDRAEGPHFGVGRKVRGGLEARRVAGRQRVAARVGRDRHLAP